MLRLLPGVAPTPLLQERLAALDAAAHTAWPGLRLDAERWAGLVADRLDGPGLEETVAALDGPGLYLTAGALGGQAAALEALDAELRRVATPALGRLGIQGTDADEVVQRARHHLLVAGDEPARLTRYRGRGALGGWLRTVVVHLASDLRRQHRPDEDFQEELLALPGGADPELEAIRADSRRHFAVAFQQALAALAARQRALLRLHAVEGLSIDRIAPVYGASRASVARWIAEARETLATETRRRLGLNLQLGSTELDSLMNLARSRLDLSIARVLREADDGREA